MGFTFALCALSSDSSLFSSSDSVVRAPVVDPEPAEGLPAAHAALRGSVFCCGSDLPALLNRVPYQGVQLG